jgi:molybdopterin adenylyltransferase
MFTVAILTVSDKGWSGERHDMSGEAVRNTISALDVRITSHGIVPDDKEVIAEKLIEWADKDGIDVIITTGGTGLSPRDVTPEATLSVVDRLAPGFAEAMRGEGLIINLPGSPKAVRECLEPILGVLPHAVETLKGEGGECASQE